MTVAANRAKLSEFWLLWENFCPRQDLANDDWETYLAFWIQKFEDIRDALTSNPVWLYWFLQRGLRHFRQFSRVRDDAYWASDGVRPLSAFRYLHDAEQCARTDRLSRLTLDLVLQLRRLESGSLHLIDYQLQYVFPMPPTLHEFDRVELHTNLDDLPTVAVFPDATFDLDWLTW